MPGCFRVITKFQFSERELVEQIAENPYLQYFIGFPGFREEAPFDATCASANIRYQHDISLLNEAREKLETMINRFCKCYAMTGKDIGLYLTIIRLYEQQQYMYDNRAHSVEHRIVSILQPWLRPIVKGKVRL